MSEWEPWSDCDTECGSGMMTRKRQVLKEPVNGGKHCSSMVQKRACMGTRCPNYPGSALKGIGCFCNSSRYSLPEKKRLQLLV